MSSVFDTLCFSKFAALAAAWEIPEKTVAQDNIHNFIGPESKKTN